MKRRNPQAQRSATPNRAAICCALFIATSSVTWKCIFASESTNLLGQGLAPGEPLLNENLLEINPSRANRTSIDTPAVGPTNIAELKGVLQLYADLRGRTLIWPKNLSIPKQVLVTDKPLTRQEARSALDAFFVLNGIGLVEVGETSVKAAPSASGQARANSNGLPSYLVHVERLNYVKPSDLVPILENFSSGIANSVAPIDSQQILVLQDLPQNVRRMKKAIREADVNLSEYISQVIPLKYARASGVAAAVTRKEASVAFKVVADEGTNSLLVFAGREDMKRIKERVAGLDIVAR